ncbi:MAG: sugar phosphate isomerase/epimerase, partial [Planctomycetota bacterium]
MKIGFSSLVCPTWNLETIVANAAKFGYQGIELRGLCGELHLPLVPELACDPEAVRRLFADNHVELVCLGASATLTSKTPRVLAQHKGAVTEFMELASKLGCPYVRIFAGEVDRRDNQRAALARIAEALISMAPIAARLGVTLLVENGGDFPGSADLWFLIDAVAHPAVGCCWNQCHAMTLGERATNSVPRLGNKIGMVHLCDGKFDEAGALLSYALPGEGDIGVKRQIEILKGLLYDRYLMFEWPKLWVDSLPAPESVLPKVAKFLR